MKNYDAILQMVSQSILTEPARLPHKPFDRTIRSDGQSGI
jgi:hypothetical protein